MKKIAIVPFLIVLTFVLFGALIFQFVYRSMQQDLNLVSANYYDMEINHQEKINLRQRSLAMNKLAEVALGDDKILSVKFDTALQVSDGYMKFIRPSEGKLDWQVPLTLLANMSELNLEQMKVGKWKAELHYTVNNTTYLKEQDLYIHK